MLKRQNSSEGAGRNLPEALPSCDTTLLQLSFTASRAKERELDALVAQLYRDELGIGVVQPDAGKCSFHRVLVAEHDGVVVAGLKAYVAGAGFAEALPTELEGVPISDYHARRFGPDSPYCEVCRVVVSKAYRQFDMQRRLIDFVTDYLQGIGCPACYWFANRVQTLGSHRVVRSLDGRPEVLGVVTVNRGGGCRELYWSCVAVWPALCGSE